MTTKGRPHKRLKVWQEAMNLAEMTYRLTESFPHTERFGLMSQMRRAAASVPANIAEGAARQSLKETVQFYFIARGSLSELDTLAELAERIKILKTERRDELFEQAERVSSLLHGLMVHVRQPEVVSGFTPESLSHVVT